MIGRAQLNYCNNAVMLALASRDAGGYLERQAVVRSVARVTHLGLDIGHGARGRGGSAGPAASVAAARGWTAGGAELSGAAP